MKHRRSAFLPRRKYILYNLALVMIPVLLLTGLFSHIMVGHVTEEMVRRYTSELEQKVRVIDERLESFSQMVAYASVDSDLSPYNLKQNSYDTVVAMQHMRQLASAQGDAVIYFYVNADDNLYSPTGKWSRATFVLRYSFDGDWTANDFDALLTSQRAYAVSPPGCGLITNSGARKYSVVVYPWRHGSIQYGAGICLIPREWFEDVLYTSLQAPLYVVDEDGHLMGRQGSADDSFISAALQSTKSEIRAGGKTWQLVRVRSGLLDWEFITAVSQDEIRSLMYGDQPWIFAVLLAFMLACVALGVMLAMRYYRPVGKLGMILGREDEEIERVHERVSDIIEHSHVMEHSLEETQDSLLRENVAKLLWSGMDEKACAELVSQNELHIDRMPSCVFAIDVFGQSPAAVENMLGMLRDRNMPAALSAHSGYIAAIVSDDTNEKATMTANELRDDAFYQLKLSLRIGIGSAVEKVSELGRSYIEAAAALKESTWGEICRFNDIVDARSKLVDKNITSATAHLSEAVSMANEKAVAEACDELEESLNNIYRETDQAIFRFTLSSVLKDLLPCLERSAPENLSWKTNLIVHALKPAAFMEQLRSLCLGCAQANRYRLSSQLNRQMAQILEYIDANFKDQNLSQAQTAAKFNMSTANLSRMFSEALGMLFVDYVSQKRMTYGAELLAGTNLSVKEIVTEVGYIDVSSFSRKFSKIYGMSPTAYRKQYSQEDEGDADE